jgi:hypothetical protein
VKVMRIAMFGAGYVLGAKAGRERYQQIVAAAHTAAQRLEKYGDRGKPADDERTAVVDTSAGDSGQQ